MMQAQLRLKMMISSSTSSRNFITRAFCSSLIAKEKVPILSSPCLILPQEEAINGKNQARTFLGRCLYDIGKKKFVPAKSKTTTQQGEKMLLLSEDSVCIGSSHGWLAFVNPNSYLLYLMNPLTLKTIPLPPLETLPRFVGHYLETSYAKGICNTCNSVFRRLDHKKEEFQVAPEYLYKKFFKKIIVSSPPDADDSADCKVVMAYNHMKSTLSFCRIGDEEWTNLDTDGHYSGYSDIVYSNRNRKLYAMDLITSFDCVDDIDYKNIDVWDLDVSHNPKKTVLKHSVKFPKPDLESNLRDSCSKSFDYLVESPEKILRIRRYVAFHVADDDVVLSHKEDPCCKLPYKTVRFDVYKFDPIKDSIDRHVTNLGDQALFVGTNHSFSLASSEFPGINANCIYFTDHFDIERSYKMHLYDKHRSNAVEETNANGGGHDSGIFSLEDNSIIPCYHGKTMNFSPRPIWLEPTHFVRN